MFARQWLMVANFLDANYEFNLHSHSGTSKAYIHTRTHTAFQKTGVLKTCKCARILRSLSAEYFFHFMYKGKVIKGKAKLPL
jgi:hypothetical protein